jgi:hypothetical protein
MAKYELCPNCNKWVCLIVMMDAVLSVVIVLIIPIKLISSSLWLCKDFRLLS